MEAKRSPGRWFSRRSGTKTNAGPGARSGRRRWILICTGLLVAASVMMLGPGAPPADEYPGRGRAMDYLPGRDDGGGGPAASLAAVRRCLHTLSRYASAAESTPRPAANATVKPVRFEAGSPVLWPHGDPSPGAEQRLLRRLTGCQRGHRACFVLCYSLAFRPLRRSPLLARALSALVGGCPLGLESAAHRRLFPPAHTPTSFTANHRGALLLYQRFVIDTYDCVLGLPLAVPAGAAAASDRVAVIVEPRPLPLFGYACRQVLLALGGNWRLQVFHSSHNEAFVRAALGLEPPPPPPGARPLGNGRRRAPPPPSASDPTSGVPGSPVVLTPLARFGLDSMAAFGNAMQSGFALHRRFYEAITSEHILWFEGDTVARGSPDESLLGHAYLGPEWAWCSVDACEAEAATAAGAVKKSSSKTGGIGALLTSEPDLLMSSSFARDDRASTPAARWCCGGGNSGWSLRRKSIMAKVATQGDLPGDLWGPGGSSLNERDPKKLHFGRDSLYDPDKDGFMWMDDVVLSLKLARLGKLPPPRAARAWGVEAVFPPPPAEGDSPDWDPAGMHKAWVYATPGQMMELLRKPLHAIWKSAAEHVAAADRAARGEPAAWGHGNVIP